LLHTVQPGETAEALASKFQANAAQILSYNNAEAKGLTAGQKIIIPDGVKVEAPKPRAATTNFAANRTLTPALTRYAFSGNGYSYGYCTWYVASKRAVPSNWGNASSWLYNAKASGFGTGRTPIPGAIAWTPSGYYGHVAYVEAVDGNRVLVSEMNYGGNWGRATRRWASAGEYGGFIY
jgi:surface antigen